MTMPVQSKGIFADAYKKFKQGKSPAQRGPHKMGVSGNSGSTYVRTIPASQGLTAEGMRKPK